MVGDLSSPWMPKGVISSPANLYSASLDQANLQKKSPQSPYCLEQNKAVHKDFGGWCIRSNWQVFLRNQHFRYDGEKSEVIIYTSEEKLYRPNKKGISSTSRKVNLRLALNTPCLQSMISHGSKLVKK